MNSYERENGIRKAARAVTDICLDLPFYGCFLLRMDVEPDDTCETAWTDGKKIGFSPNLFNQLTPSGCRFVVIHETMHVMLKHHLREGLREHGKWNSACDYVIHCLMHEDRIAILDWVLFDAKFLGMTSEQVYKLLPDQPKMNGTGGSGTSSGKAPEDVAGKGISGSIGEVRQQKNEDGSDMSSAEKAEAAREIDVAIAQAVNQARAAGKGTVAQERFCKDILESKVGWETELRQYLEQFAKDDYNWSMPNRRFCSYGLYLPTLKSESMPDMAFLIDTSCSVSNKELQQFMSEVAAILQIFKVRIWVIYVDTKVHNPQEFNSDEFWNIEEFKPDGFGGTDFRPGFEWIEEQGIEPAVAVYLTDLDCNRFPDEEPDYPVIWCNTNAYNNNRKNLPFGRQINIDSFD